MAYSSLARKFRIIRIRRWVRRFVRYFIFTMGGIVAELILIWILAHVVWPEWEFGVSVIAPTLGFELCLLVNYSAVSYFVWRDRHSSLWRFHVSNASVYVVKMFFLLAIRYLAGVEIVLCTLLSTMLAGILNFVLNDRVVFQRDKK